MQRAEERVGAHPSRRFSLADDRSLQQFDCVADLEWREPGHQQVVTAGGKKRFGHNSGKWQVTSDKFYAISKIAFNLILATCHLPLATISMNPEWIGYMAAFLTTAAYVPQLVKVFRHRHTKR